MEIDISEALERKDLLFIDVRSPKEFCEASIPGALNIPLFNNNEQKELGTVYHQTGEIEARKKALEIAAPKLPTLVEKIVALCGEKIPLFYCRRGGLRSLSISMVFSLTGLQSARLKQGYKSYRRYVHTKLENYKLPCKLFVLNGLTGVGKTAIIKELQKMKIPAIDLEGLAAHRGSVFGFIGFKKPRSQKDFEAMLLNELESFKDAPYLVIEGEGKKIGNIYLPHFLISKMEKAYHILLTTDLETRISRIVNCYIPQIPDAQCIQDLKDAVIYLKNRLGNNLTQQVVDLIDRREFDKAVRLMCINYYDHYYKESNPQQNVFNSTLDSTNIENTTKQIIAIINKNYSVRTNRKENLVNECS